MKKQSAGLLLYRRSNRGVEVLLVHPGGPFWAKKDAGVWSLPKGEFAADEDPLAAAKREFQEEVGQPAPVGSYLSLGTAQQASGKVVHAWALEADLDVSHIQSNTFTIEWPPHSGQQQAFPEIDKAGWFPLAVAGQKLVKDQSLFLERLVTHLGQSLSVPRQGSTAQAQLF